MDDKAKMKNQGAGGTKQGPKDKTKERDQKGGKGGMSSNYGGDCPPNTKMEKY